MGAALKHLQDLGLSVRLTGDGRMAVTGGLTDDARQYIREYKPLLLAELTAANDPAESLPDELCALVSLTARLEGWEWDKDFALAVMRNQIAEGVPVAELIAMMYLNLEIHHGGAWS